jgi:8-oxo-dGTP diphosphatase
LVYEAEAVGSELESDGQEAVGAGFFPPERLPEPLCGGGHDRAIKAWQARALDRWQPGLAMRYCPHCTHALEERLAFDRMRRVCPACGFVNFREPKVGVSVLVEQEGRILLVQRAVDPGQGLWSLPSGFVEWDESPEAAAIRECAEETGLIVEILDLMSVRHYTDDYRGPGLNLTYRGRVTGGILRSGDDAQAARWYAPAEAPEAEQIAFVNHRILVERWRMAARAGC